MGVGNANLRSLLQALVWDIGIWDLEFIWDLVLGIWDFNLTVCSPANTITNTNTYIDFMADFL